MSLVLASLFVSVHHQSKVRSRQDAMGSGSYVDQSGGGVGNILGHLTNQVAVLGIYSEKHHAQCSLNRVECSSIFVLFILHGLPAHPIWCTNKACALDPFSPACLPRHSTKCDSTNNDSTTKYEVRH